jgi:hypothetical protein
MSAPQVHVSQESPPHDRARMKRSVASLCKAHKYGESELMMPVAEGDLTLRKSTHVHLSDPSMFHSNGVAGNLENCKDSKCFPRNHRLFEGEGLCGTVLTNVRPIRSR